MRNSVVCPNVQSLFVATFHQLFRRFFVMYWLLTFHLREKQAVTNLIRIWEYNNCSSWINIELLSNVYIEFEVSFQQLKSRLYLKFKIMGLPMTYLSFEDIWNFLCFSFYGQVRQLVDLVAKFKALLVIQINSNSLNVSVPKLFFSKLVGNYAKRQKVTSH